MYSIRGSLLTFWIASVASLVTLSNQIEAQDTGLLSIGDRTLCKAMILTERHILARASCSMNYKPHTLNFSVGADSFAQVRDVAEIEQHPEFNWLSLQHDWSVISLSSALEFSSEILPVSDESLAAQISPEDLAWIYQASGRTPPPQEPQCVVDLVDQGYIRVSNVADLLAMPSDADANYVMTNHIDLASSGFATLQFPGSGFSGVFDGCDFELRNWTYNSTSNQAAFMNRNIGTIRRVKAVNWNISQAWSVAGFALENSGTIEYVELQNSTLLGSGDVAGIALLHQGTGILRYSKVSGSNLTGNNVGGIAYMANQSESGVLGAVSVQNTTLTGVSVGGLVNRLTGRLQQSRFQGTIRVSAPSYGNSGPVGGAVANGSHGGIVNEVLTEGQINFLSNSSAQAIGGIMGYAQFTWTITNCLSRMNINLNWFQTGVGGIIGATQSQQGYRGTLANNLALGAIAGTGSHVGGVLGRNWEGPVPFTPLPLDVFWDSQAVGVTSSVVGGSLTTAQAQTSSTYGPSWDRVMVWNIVNGSYPSLRRVPQ